MGPRGARLGSGGSRQDGNDATVSLRGSPQRTMGRRVLIPVLTLGCVPNPLPRLLQISSHLWQPGKPGG